MCSLEQITLALAEIESKANERKKNKNMRISVCLVMKCWLCDMMISGHSGYGYRLHGIKKVLQYPKRVTEAADSEVDKIGYCMSHIPVLLSVLALNIHQYMLTIHQYIPCIDLSLVPPSTIFTSVWFPVWRLHEITLYLINTNHLRIPDTRYQNDLLRYKNAHTSPISAPHPHLAPPFPPTN